MNTKVTVKDNGLKQLLKSLHELPTVTVGVHQEAGAALSSSGDATVAEVAAFHEFGLGVPERSWLRDFVDENRTELLSMLRASALEVAKGANAHRQMERFGLAVVGMIKERIIAGIEPSLKEVTKLRKQQITGGAPKDTPLILFSQFIGSIAHEVT